MLSGHGRLSTSRTVYHGQSSGKISIAAKHCGERALKNAHLKKGYTPQNLDKKGDRGFRRRRRPCSPSSRLQIKIYSVCRALWAPPNHPEFFFVFSSV